MNDKLKELMLEAGYAAPEIAGRGQLLAELIVRECAGIVEDYGLSLVGSDENYLGETLNLSIRVQEAGNKIKQHFGVEE